jgi:hypothetical protein
MINLDNGDGPALDRRGNGISLTIKAGPNNSYMTYRTHFPEWREKNHRTIAFGHCTLAAKLRPVVLLFLELPSPLPSFN